MSSGGRESHPRPPAVKVNVKESGRAPGPSVFPSGEPGVSGDFWGRIMGAKYRLALQDGTWDIF